MRVTVSGEEVIRKLEDTSIIVRGARKALGRFNRRLSLGTLRYFVWWDFALPVALFFAATLSVTPELASGLHFLLNDSWATIVLWWGDVCRGFTEGA
jgi:hypothetical protein